MSDGVEEATDAVVILSTAAKQEEAVAIARGLLEARLVACVNVVPGVRSLYRWEGKVQDDAEVLMVIKTSGEKKDAAIRKLKELHSYSCPEALAVCLAGGSSEYLSWIGEVTG